VRVDIAVLTMYRSPDVDARCIATAKQRFYFPIDKPDTYLFQAVDTTVYGFLATAENAYWLSYWTVEGRSEELDKDFVLYAQGLRYKPVHKTAHWWRLDGWGGWGW
jgi:hypothetical protein